MSNVLEYKGYHTVVNYDSKDNMMHGIIEGIADYVDFETDDLSKVEDEFRKAVDDYLDFCEEVGKNPEKEYKGSFSIRISPVLHRKLVLEASKSGKSLNATVEQVLSKVLEDA